MDSRSCAHSFSLSYLSVKVLAGEHLCGWSNLSNGVMCCSNKYSRFSSVKLSLSSAKVLHSTSSKPQILQNR